MNPNTNRSRWGAGAALASLGLIIAAAAAQPPAREVPKVKQPWMDRSLSPDRRADNATFPGAADGRARGGAL